MIHGLIIKLRLEISYPAAVSSVHPIHIAGIFVILKSEETHDLKDYVNAPRSPRHRTSV